MRGQRWSLRLGPMCVELKLGASDGLSVTLARRLACVRTACDDDVIDVELTAKTDTVFRTDDKTLVREDGDEVERHDFRLHRHGLGWRCETMASPVAVEAALRWVTAVELMRRGGLLLHASSVVVADRGHLFLGPSGAGKTTIALECRADRVLSDEVSIVARDTERWMVFPSPFWGLERVGEAGSPAPLAAVWLLGGRQATEARPVPAADAALGLFSRVVAIDAGKRTNEAVLDAIEQIIDEVPVSSLSWRRGDDVRSVLTSSALPSHPVSSDETDA